MCGISGIFDPSGKTAPHQDIKTMNGAISYRGPDGDGFWDDQEHGIAFGHRRLAIIDLSEAGHQPMHSHSGRFVMSYNGEIYNYLDLRGPLEKEGHVFTGRSDTEVLLAGFESWGVRETLAKISGMFAILLWDRKDKTLTLIRDFLGKKPIYVGWAGSALVIASELKALLAHPAFEARVSRKAQGLYFRYACVPAPFSIYENVWQMRPGSILEIPLERFEHGADLSAHMQSYWSALDAVQNGAAGRHSSISEAQALEGFTELFETSVRERMISDVPLGAFLSGGIDSSAVTALMQKQSDKPVKTFSIGFDVEGFNEAEHAKAVAAHLGTEHHEMYLSAKDALDVVPHLPHIYDEPFADISQIPTYLVARFAREHVTVALSGDGGDELLGGYRRHTLIPPLWRKISLMPMALRNLAANTLAALPPRLINMAEHLGVAHPTDSVDKLAGLLAAGKAAQAHDFLLGFWSRGEAPVPSEPLHLAQPLPKDLSFAEELMARDAVTYLPNDILVKVDRASMAVSLEARAPLLDRRLFEYAWSLPQDMKVKGKTGKWLLRQVLNAHVPEELTNRPKKGFSPPVKDWLLADLKGWAEELLSPAALEQNGLNAAPVARAWEDLKAGRRNSSVRLWSVLMYQSWAKENL